MDQILIDQFLQQLNDPELINDEDKRFNFFQNPSFQQFFLLTYAEFLQIWGFDFDEEQNTQKLNKWLIYSQIDWYNNIYNEAWAWKWYPLIFKFCFNTIRRRPTSVFLSLFWVGTCDFLLDRYMVFKNLHKRKIKINKLFNHNLSKTLYIKQRQQYFDKYRDIISKAIQQDTIIYEYAPINFIVAGERINIYQPNFEWEQERNTEVEKLRVQFFCRNNQLANLTSRIGSTLGYFRNNLRSTEGRDRVRKDIVVFLNDNVYSLPSQLQHEAFLFKLYKENIEKIPNGLSKFDSLLAYEKINKQKLFYMLDDVKLQMSRVMNTWNYYIYGKIQFRRYEFKIFHNNLFEVKPDLKIERYIYDFFTFTAFCLIPAKILFSRKNIVQSFNSFKKQAMQQSYKI